MFDSIQPCTETNASPGDGVDNDCDERIDEETLDGLGMCCNM